MLGSEPLTNLIRLLFCITDVAVHFVQVCKIGTCWYDTSSSSSLVGY